MATETPQAKKTTPHIEDKELFGNMWETTMDMQRQWLGFWTRPLGNAPKADQMWGQMHDFNTEFLDLHGRAAELAHHFVNDQVKIGREFTDKALDMTRKLGDREPKETAPEFARELFDSTRRATKRTFAFNNDSLKVFEDFGLKVSETITQAPVEAK